MATDGIEATLEVFILIISLLVFIYALRLRRTFRGGVMEPAFNVLVLAPLLFALAEGCDLLSGLNLIPSLEGAIVDALEVLFIATLLVGFKRLADVWQVKKDSANHDKTT